MASEFTQKVLQIVEMVPKGKVVNYGQISLMAGFPRGARQVGWVLHQYGDEVPWWRVINNAGRISTRCVEHHASLQKELLRKEAVEVKENLDVDIEKYRWRPSERILGQLELEDEYIFKILEKYSF